MSTSDQKVGANEGAKKFLGGHGPLVPRRNATDSLGSKNFACIIKPTALEALAGNSLAVKIHCLWTHSAEF